MHVKRCRKISSLCLPLRLEAQLWNALPRHFYRHAGGYLLVLIFFLNTHPCLAEELSPRRWSHLPIDTNFIGTAYVFTDADIDLDPVLEIENGQMSLNTWGLQYIRTFALFERSTRIELLQAYHEGRWSGILEGDPATVKRSGLSDTLVRFAINLCGAPPLRRKEFGAYRATQKVETIVGVGLSAQLPTGDYMDDKLINLGNNRYTIRPQIGIEHKRGNWSTEATGLIAFHTDNNDFFNGKKLEQEPFYTIHGHLTYTFRPGLWASASAGYSSGGRKTVDGVEKDDRRDDLSWALSLGIPITRNLGVKMAYIGTRKQEFVGIDSDSFTIGVSAFW